MAIHCLLQIYYKFILTIYAQTLYGIIIYSIARNRAWETIEVYECNRRQSYEQRCE